MLDEDEEVPANTNGEVVEAEAEAENQVVDTLEELDPLEDRSLEEPQMYDTSRRIEKAVIVGSDEEVDPELRPYVRLFQRDFERIELEALTRHACTASDSFLRYIFQRYTKGGLGDYREMNKEEQAMMQRAYRVIQDKICRRE